MSIILHERLSRFLQSSIEIKPRVNDEMISTSVKADKPSIRRIDLANTPEKALEAYYTDAKPLGKALSQKEKDTGSFTLTCFINNICFNKALADLGASVSVMPYSTYTTLGLGDLISTKLIIELANRTVKRPKRIVENVLVGIDKITFLVDFSILDIPKDFKTPLILGRPFLSTAHAIINVFKAKIALSIGNDKIFFKHNKPTSNIIKRFYALSLIKITEIDLEARVIGNALRKNISHDPKFEDYIELSDLNEPLELRHDQVVNLGPTIEIKDYPSFSNPDRKIHVNDAYNLRFFFMIDKLEFKGKSVVGAFKNAPIFVGTFSVVTDFVVIEDMDHYRDEEMGDVIVGKPFCEVLASFSSLGSGVLSNFESSADSESMSITTKGFGLSLRLEEYVIGIQGLRCWEVLIS
uniref:Reverse transcriptase domain-containing protein n=1 Tax=Tanacetum cinerariifolium TaxID=118510 RepID=A0A699HYQ8_TANCI|nr:hypothetical protein [Tanacetum cinerariifolium]